MRAGIAKQSVFEPAGPPDIHRSGIVSVKAADRVTDPNEAMKQLTSEFRRRNIRATSRAGYIRIGAHYYNSDDEITAIVDAIQTAAS